MTFADAEVEVPAEDLWDEGLYRQGKARYRARRRKNYGRAEHQAKLRATLVERQQGLCHYCSRKLSDPPRPGEVRADNAATLEHLVSHLDGGTSSEENCRAVCNLCNALKGKLDHAIRSLERSMHDGFDHEVHYYATNLRRALSQWEARLASVDGRRMAETGTGSGRSPTSAVGEAETPKGDHP